MISEKTNPFELLGPKFVKTLHTCLHASIFKTEENLKYKNLSFNIIYRLVTNAILVQNVP